MFVATHGDNQDQVIEIDTKPNLQGEKISRSINERRYNNIQIIIDHTCMDVEFTWICIFITNLQIVDIMFNFLIIKNFSYGACIEINIEMWNSSM